MPTLKEIFMIDKLFKIRDMVKKVGGTKAFIKQRYLTDDNRAGEFVGQDEFGNKYYEDNTFFVPRNRYVIYAERVWLNYDASQIPPEWHRWIHHICDEPPTVKPLHMHKWQLGHKENTSIDLSRKFVPYSTTRSKIEAWQPNQRKYGIE